MSRGRLTRNRWVDEQVSWQAATEFYSPMPGAAADGRLAFDAMAAAAT